MFTVDTIIEQVKLLYGLIGETDFPIEDTNVDLKKLVVSTVTNHIKNYCNITEIPNELEQTVVSMTFDYLRMKSGKANFVTSIKEGDTSVNFADTSDELLKDHKNLLNKYRRMVW